MEEEIWSEYDDLYGDEFVDDFKPFGEDGKRILDRYGDDLADVFDGLSDADIKKAIELVNEYGDEAVELLKKGWSVDDVKAVLECGSYSHPQNLDGLDEIRKHLTDDVEGLDFEPNKAMMNKIEEILTNNQELTGAYKDFYEHELTESILMKQGYSYDDAHNMALGIHDVVPQTLYSPEIVEEYYKWFNKSDYEYWGITIGRE